MKRHIPNFVTCLNVLCGTFAVFFTLGEEFVAAAGCIVMGIVFDFLDGLLARLLKAYSPMGKELDSLADMVTSGIAPGFIAYALLCKIQGIPVLQTNLGNLTSPDYLLAFSAFLIPVCSALRLAKFNTDTRQTEGFIGVPTPANSIFWAMLAYFYVHPADHTALLYQNHVIIPLIIVMSLLLVAPIPMLSFKMKSFAWAHNKERYILLAILAGMILFGGIGLVIFIIPVYIIYSACFHFFSKK